MGVEDMKVLILSAIVAACLALASAQKPEECLSPGLISADVAFFDPQKQETVIAKYFYDMGQKRSASVDEVFENGENRTFYWFIDLGQEHKLYDIHFITKDDMKCRVFNNPNEFEPLGVPQNSTWRGTITIALGLFANMWTHDFHRHGYIAHWEGTFSEKEQGCLPINMNNVVHGRGFTHTAFYNITIGITNPDVFVPPPACNNAVVEELPAHLRR